MAVGFFVKEGNAWVQKNFDTGANFRSTQDESLDDGEIVLDWVSSEQALKPRTLVQLQETDSNNVVIHKWVFSVLCDNIEPVDKDNQYFVHRLTLIQSTHNLSHRFLRTSIFQQPIDDKKALTIAHGFLYVTAEENEGGTGYIYSTDGRLNLPRHNTGGGTFQENVYRSDDVYIETNEKINNVFVDIDTWCLSNRDITRLDLGETFQFRNPTTNFRSWKRNRHNTFEMQIEYRNNPSNINPDATETITIQAGNSANRTLSQSVAKAFVSTHGSGWYRLALKTNQLPTFNIESSEMVYTITGDIDSGGVVGVKYASVQVLLKASLRIDTYYYSLYDILVEIYWQSLKKLNGTNRGTEPYQLATSGQYSVKDLQDIVAPDFHFSGLSVFEAVNRVFEYIDAVPILSESNHLYFEYLNEFNGETLPADTPFADRKTRLEDKYYDNQIITQYQGARQPTPVTFPGKKVYKKFESKTYGVVHIEDYIITTDKPIEKINKLNIKFPGLSFQFSMVCNYQYKADTVNCTKVIFDNFSFPEDAIDIAPKIYESQKYYSQNVGSYADASDNQSNTMYFTKGEKSFPVGIVTESEHTYYKPQIIIDRILNSEWKLVSDWSMTISGNYPNYWEYYYQIEYVATFEGQTMVESPENKEEGQFIVAQNSSTTALNKMGSNMLGFIAKTGNESKAVTMQLTTYDARLVKGSKWIDDNGNKWIANIVKISFTTGDEIITDVEFVKNFNMISQRTNVDEDIKYYQINRQIAAKGFENVNEYLYFSYESFASQDETAFTDSLVDSLLRGTFGTYLPAKKTADVCVIGFDQSYNILCPLHVYGAGNVLEFEFNFEDTTLAGNYIKSENSQIVSKSALYNEEGFASGFQAVIYSVDSQISLEEYPWYDNMVATSMVYISSYIYHKRPSEIFSFTYGVALMSKPGEQIFFGEEFLSQNALVPNNKCAEVDRKLYLYVSDTEEYGINDKKAKGGRITSSSLSFTINTTSKYIRFSAGNNEYGTAKSWCIADENENIYIAGNSKITANGHYEVILYYAKKKLRM